MENNQKNFNLFVFLSTFSRNLIEIFIPVILYKFGYSLNEVIFYYFLVNLISLLLSYPCVYFSKKFNNKLLCLIGIVFFVTTQFLLSNIFYSNLYIFILSFSFALYRRCYWLSRRYYNLNIIKKKDISLNYAIISIVNQIAVIVSSYIGSLFLDFLTLDVLTIISTVLFTISLIPLNNINVSKNNENSKLSLISTIKKIPFSNLYLFGSYELINVVKFLFPLYLFIYVKSNYQVVGVINLLTNLATIVFSYFYGKKINNSRNYLNLSIIFLVVTFILKVNFTSYILILIAFLEGIALKMCELSISKEFYSFSKNFDYFNYNLMYEFMQNSFRTIVVLILFLYGSNIEIMIYIVLIFIAIGVLLKFKQIEGGSSGTN